MDYQQLASLRWRQGNSKHEEEPVCFGWLRQALDKH